jgi:hypothetical protein
MQISASAMICLVTGPQPPPIRAASTIASASSSSAARAPSHLPPRAEDDPDQPDRIVRLTISGQLKRTGKEMKFVCCSTQHLPFLDEGTIARAESGDRAAVAPISSAQRAG